MIDEHMHAQLAGRRELWHRVKSVLDEALERPPEDRAAVVRQLCGGDPDVEREALRLLAQEASAARLISAPALAVLSPTTAAALSDALELDDLTGQRLGAYELQGPIGRGGMGTVYLASRIDGVYRQQVAVKILKRGLDTGAMLQRFRAERQILANLTHPYIARLLDGGATADGRPYLVLEYIEGQPITRFCEAQAFSVEDRLTLFRKVCDAVHFAHSRLVVHRDLKPSNILVTADGTPKLLDFGIAKLLTDDLTDESVIATASMMRLMTPDYAAPEQVKGETITTATDVYALGLLLYELLTAQRPFRVKQRSEAEVWRAICETEPAKPSTAAMQGLVGQVGQVGRVGHVGQVAGGPAGTPEKLRRRLAGDLDTIVLKALRKEPERRYRSVEQLSDDIRRHLDREPVLARADTWRYRTGRFVARHRVSVAAAVLLVFSLSAGIAATTWQARAAHRERARAEQRFDQVRTLASNLVFDYYDAIKELPGATPVRERLVKDGLTYLDSLAAESADSPAVQRDIAAAYLRLGHAQGAPLTASLGDSTGALASYRKAVALGHQALQPNAADPDVRAHLAQSYQAVCHIYAFVKSDPAEAVRQCTQALEHGRAAAAARPSDAELKRKVASVHMTLGTVLGRSSDVANLGNGAAALEHYRDAAILMEQVTRDAPHNRGYRQETGALYSQMGLLLNDSGDLQGSRASYRKALAIDEALQAEEPHNALFTRETAVQHGNIASSLMRTGDHAAALDQNRRAVVLYEQLAAADPKNVGARKDLAIGYRNMAVVSAAVGDGARASAYFRNAIDQFQKCLSVDPGNAYNRRQLAFTYVRLSRFQIGGDPQAAVASAQEAVTISRGLVNAEPRNTSAQRTLADGYEALGAAHAKLAGAARKPDPAAHWSAARDAYRQAVAVWTAMKQAGTLTPSDRNKPDEIASELAKCERALAEARWSKLPAGSLV